MRRLCLDALNEIGNPHFARPADEQMNMVDVASYGGGNAACFFHLVSKHPEHLISEIRMLKEWSAVFGGEDNVEPDLDQ